MPAVVEPPAVNRSGSDKISLSIGHPEHKQLRDAMIALRKKVTSEADYVGDKFAEEARKIHYGETEARHIYGESTIKEAKELIEEGIEIAPLPPDPDDLN